MIRPQWRPWKEKARPCAACQWRERNKLKYHMHSKTKTLGHAQTQPKLRIRVSQMQNSQRTRFKLQGWPLSTPRLPRPPGSPSLGQDSVGNFVIFGRAGQEQRRRGYGLFLELCWRQDPCEARSCHATAPCSSSTEAAVSTTRHSRRAAGKCGRVEVEITQAGTK